MPVRILLVDDDAEARDLARAVLVAAGHEVFTVGAELVDSEALRDAHLVYHAATWTRGTFEFVDGPVEGDDAIRMSTPELLLEAARRQDERQ